MEESLWGVFGLLWVLFIYYVALKGTSRSSPPTKPKRRYSDKTIVLIAALLFFSVVGIVALAVVFLMNKRKKALNTTVKIIPIDNQQD